MIRVGFAGGGVVSDGHLTSLLSDQRVKVTGVADPNPEIRRKIVSTYGLPVLDDYRKLLGESDLLYLCTPNYLHHEMALEAIALGKHVIAEKPLALDAAQANEMVQAADRAGVRLFVAENFRYVPELARVREVILSGEIGSPFLCLSCFIGDEYARMNNPDHWKGTKEASGGGVVIDNGPHMLDTLYYLFGEVASVFCAGGRLVIEAQNKAEDTAEIILVFKNGVVANCSLTFAARYNAFPRGYAGFGVRLDVNATGGSIHTTLREGVTVVDRNRVARLEEGPWAEPVSMDKDFIDAILGEYEPRVTGRDGLYVMRLVDACYKSREQARLVGLDEV